MQPFSSRAPLRLAQLVLPVCLALGVGQAVAQEQITGRITSFAFVDDSDDAKTSSTTLVEMPGTALTFRSNKAGPALIQFCGKVSPADIVLVEARVDGQPVAPYEIVLDAEAYSEIPVFETHCFNWASPRLKPGRHSVQMMFRSLGGEEIVIQQRTLTALYR